MLKHCLLILLFILVVLGCSQPKKHQRNQVKFTTYITPEGLKQFQLSQLLPTNKKQGSSHRGRGGNKGGGRNHNERPDRKKQKSNGEREQRLIQVVEEHIKETAYCHEGYSVSDQYVENGSMILNGLCHEKASKDDWLKFSQQ